MLRFYKNRQEQRSTKISTQLWEVLTVFTVTLSIATAIIWVNNTTPREVQQDFVYVDRVKSSIINDTQKISSLPDKSNESVVKNINVDYVKIDKEDYDKYIKLINESQDSFNNLVTNLKDSDNVFKNIESLNSTIKNYENYLTEKRILYENYYTFSSKNLEIKKEVNRLSSADISSYQDSQVIKDNIDYLEKIQLNDEDFASKIELWETKMNELKNEASGGFTDTKKIKELKDLYLSIMEHPLINHKQSEELEKSKLNLLSSLTNLENWQKSYIQDNGRLLSDTKITALENSNLN